MKCQPSASPGKDCSSLFLAAFGLGSCSGFIDPVLWSAQGISQTDLSTTAQMPWHTCCAAYADCFIDPEKLPAETLQVADLLVTGTLGLAYSQTAAAMHRAVELARKSPTCEVWHASGAAALAPAALTDCVAESTARPHDGRACP